MSNVGAVSHSRAMHLAESAVRYANTDQAEYEKALTGLVAALPELDPKERKDVLAQLRSTDARVFAQLQSRDDVQKSAKLRNSIRAVLASDTEHLGTAARAKMDATPIQLNRFASGQAGIAALLAEQIDRIKAAGPLAEAQSAEIGKMEAERERHPYFSAATRALGSLTSTAAHEQTLESAKTALQSAEAKAADESATKEDRAAARALVKETKAVIKRLNGQIRESRDRGGFILDEPEGREFLAHLCGLPSRLSKAQKTAAGSLDLDALLASLGSADAVPRQFAEKMIEARAGDPAALHQLEGMAASLSGLAAPPDPAGSSSHAAPPNAPGSSSHAAPPNAPGSSHGSATQALGHAVALAPGLQGMSPTVQNKLAQLQHSNPQAYNMISDHLVGQQRSKANAERCYREIMGLINSGMPIEAVIVFVMILLAERQEEKFNDKVKELTAYEQIDKMNAAAKEQIETLKHAAKLDPATLSQEIDSRTARIGQLKAAGGNGSLAEIGKLEDELSLLRKYGTSLDVGRDIADLEKSLVEPTDFGLKQKSSTIVMQELQAEMQIYMQVMQALAGVLRQIQDLVMTPVHNIR